MKGFLPQFQQNNVKIVSFCPICETKYKMAHAKILDERDDAQLLHLTCHSCKARVLAVVLMSHVGVNSIGLLTDLSAAEVTTFKQLSELTSDEVIDMHNLLEASDVQTLFKLEE